ncbi:MAG TPA: hypothetical protein VGL37_09490 [Solirubrobacteraceae bacterium]|jgi:hypothetical protein
MAARTIVTFHPDVACDLCGRRLLRGERPDVFLGGGQRRMVCELCAPRATHEGWRREVDAHLTSPRAQHPQRSRSLLGRLRQLREPVQASDHRADPATSESPGSARRAGATTARSEWAGVESEWSGADEQWAGGLAEDPSPEGYVGALEEHGGESAQPPSGGPSSGTDPGSDGAADEAVIDGAAYAGVLRALEIFNAGEPPRRVAGVARSLGAACVRATPVTGKSTVAIVVAWELCWYRYEIDLADEAAGVTIAAEGMELEELPAEDRVANAAADEHGMLSLLAN